MDDPELDSGEHLLALRGLARLNRMSLVVGPIILEARRLAQTMGRRVRLVDIAAGSGDVTIQVVRRAGVPIDLTLMDISPRAMQAASLNAARVNVAMSSVTGDVLTKELPEGDLMVCSLFLHHLDQDRAISLLKRMRDAASATVLVSDLRRCAHGRFLAGVVPRLLTRSRVVQIDAVRSSRAAWSILELRRLADRAGLRGAEVRPRFPARMIMKWRTPT